MTVFPHALILGVFVIYSCATKGRIHPAWRDERTLSQSLGKRIEKNSCQVRKGLKGQ